MRRVLVDQNQLAARFDENIGIEYLPDNPVCRQDEAVGRLRIFNCLCIIGFRLLIDFNGFHFLRKGILRNAVVCKSVGKHFVRAFLPRLTGSLRGQRAVNLRLGGAHRVLVGRRRDKACIPQRHRHAGVADTQRGIRCR